MLSIKRISGRFTTRGRFGAFAALWLQTGFPGCGPLPLIGHRGYGTRHWFERTREYAACYRRQEAALPLTQRVHPLPRRHCPLYHHRLPPQCRDTPRAGGNLRWGRLRSGDNGSNRKGSSRWAPNKSRGPVPANSLRGVRCYPRLGDAPTGGSPRHGVSLHWAAGDCRGTVTGTPPIPGGRSEPKLAPMPKAPDQKLTRTPSRNDRGGVRSTGFR
jgi:hypothetical protein